MGGREVPVRIIGLQHMCGIIDQRVYCRRVAKPDGFPHFDGEGIEQGFGRRYSREVNNGLCGLSLIDICLRYFIAQLSRGHSSVRLGKGIQPA